MSTPILKLENVKKSFGSKEVLKGVDLEVQKGESLGDEDLAAASRRDLRQVGLGQVGDAEKCARPDDADRRHDLV